MSAANDLSKFLHDIADHIDAGDEFHNGEWSHHGPPEGLNQVPFLGRRTAWVDGVLTARECHADQLRRIADWEWAE